MTSGGQRGSGTVLTGVIAAGLVGFLLLGLWLIGWVTSVHRAGRVADLAALAGAQAQAAGRDACATARETARRNGAEVTSCTLKGSGTTSFVLLVETSTPLRPAISLPGAPRQALGAAAAGPAGSP